MHVSAGTRLGPYEISSRLGAGGMGEVWRAKDTRLDRSVAIKILPAELADHAQLRVRLEREAKVISQLNHPNICTLYDVGENYLVMELLEGETLADRLARGPLPLADVLRYGIEIAEALDRAHRAGIVHRDLKPGNVMLTKTGAKLLDFGLARSEVQAVVDQYGATQQKALTEEGTILGTFQYMAPEQLEAQPADARTDMFAFGCVLYEMLTGRRAFAGKTKTSLIAAIVSAQPQPLSLVQPLTPPALEHVIQKCLEKEPDERWQSAHDVAGELRWIGRQLETDAKVQRSGRKAPWVVVALLALLAIAAGALYLRERNRSEPPIAFALAPPAGHAISHGAISPDGKSIAFRTTDLEKANTFTLWVREVGEITPRALSSGELNKPFWSPDGKWIGYFGPDGLKRIQASGGEPEKITADSGYGVGASWSPDGTILFTREFGQGLVRVPATGGPVVQVTQIDRGRRETLHGWPHFLPDGKNFLFLIHTVGEEQNEIHVGSLDGKHRLLMRADSLVGVARGSLLFVRDGSLYAQAFDGDDHTLSGEPRRIEEGVVFSEDAAHSYATVARNGAYFYIPVQKLNTSFAWHDRTGRLLAPLFAGEDFNAMRIFRDASKVLLTKFDARKGASDVYTYDVERSVLTRVTGGRSNHQSAQWSPSGDRIYFSADREGLYDIFMQVEDGTAPAEVFWRNDRDKHVLDISPDGTSMLVEVYEPKSGTDIWVAPIPSTAGKPRPLISSEAHEGTARFSPDGRWITYTSNRSGRTEAYVRRFPEGRSVQVSVAGGRGPQWSRDGREIAFWNDANELAAAPLVFEGDLVRPGRAQTLFRLSKSMFGTSLSPIDDRILIRSAPEGNQLAGVLHYVQKAW